MLDWLCHASSVACSLLRLFQAGTALDVCVTTWQRTVNKAWEKSGSMLTVTLECLVNKAREKSGSMLSVTRECLSSGNSRRTLEKPPKLSAMAPLMRPGLREIRRFCLGC